jgi:hypothetical protein
MEGKMKRLSALLYLFIILITLAFLGFNNIVLAADITYGNWHMIKVNKGEFFPTTSDMRQLSSQGIVFPESARPACAAGSNNCWGMAAPLPKSPEYQPYALFVREYGYTFMESTRDGNTEHLRWGWKMVVENKSKNDVIARAHCELRDKNNFVLTTYDDGDAMGEFVWKGQKTTLQEETVWSYSRHTKPYPPGRVSTIHCYLLLRHIE